MITRDRVLEIINSTNPEELEQIHVITRYIFDKTQEDISGVNINPPQHQGMIILMNHMYNLSKKYYRNGNI